MLKFFPALAFAFALQTAFAGQIPVATAPDAATAGGLMHATLVVPAQPGGGAQRTADPSALKAGLQGDADAAAKKDEAERHTTGMLLAALALMAGIVLRRWGGGER